MTDERTESMTDQTQGEQSVTQEMIDAAIRAMERVALPGEKVYRGLVTIGLQAALEERSDD